MGFLVDMAIVDGEFIYKTNTPFAMFHANLTLYVEFFFIPNQKGSNGFSGTCWATSEAEVLG